MTSSRPAQAAGIIAQQIRKIAPKGKDSARLDSGNSDTPQYPHFLPDLCSVTGVTALVLMGELLALVLVLATDGIHPFNWQRLGLVSLTVQWVTLPAAAILCRLRPFLAQLTHKLAAALSYCAVLAVLLLVLLGQHWWAADMASTSIDWLSLLANFLVGAICAGVVLRYAYVQQQLHNQQQAELGARIEALQSRIRPHFLFNSMNSLASLIAVDAERAEKLVEDLSALFRASLADSKMVPLEQEIALAKRYLEIESLRLGDRLQQEWQVDVVSDGLQVPSMLLQPLLENAVLHGVARLRGGGVIEIAVREQQSARQNVIGSEVRELLLSIHNPVAEANTESARNRNAHLDAHDGNGMAMENIRQRLSAFYGNRFRFSAEQKGGVYQVELHLPMNAEVETRSTQPVHAPARSERPQASARDEVAL
ncbi:histidine kinase [Microbulbifer agarilyticus]|uniref:sensor histidine kinase n=1 Tax=Microbulbifer agarilyticus TaxID=260552 RepID=UPI001C98D63F|nr:histidine kinase [Microbulbifer agarilyticus]MBY6190650.1 histidine kinase [Microbulbifer agarilyticus]